MKKSLIVFISLFFVIFGIYPATANDTYAMIDDNGMVTNIIVCGADCEGGSFAGQTVVKQVSKDPITGEHRGGVWQGPNTTTYSNNGVFTVNHIGPVTRTEIEIDDQNIETISSVTVDSTAYSFSYEDTLFNNLDWSKVLKDTAPTLSTGAKVSVLKNNEYEFLDFEKSKTTQEIEEVFVNNNLNLLFSKIQTLISLLGSWVK
jgi:hypothetical protein